MHKSKFQKGFLRCSNCLKWLHPKLKIHGAGEIIADSIGRLYHNPRFCPVRSDKSSTRLRHKSKYRLGRRQDDKILTCKGKCKLLYPEMYSIFDKRKPGRLCSSCTMRVITDDLRCRCCGNIFRMQIITA